MPSRQLGRGDELRRLPQTYFFRALVSARKIDQHAPSKVYSFVPVQDFSRPWTDIDLFTKYGLDAPARKWIETNIREMK